MLFEVSFQTKHKNEPITKVVDKSFPNLTFDLLGKCLKFIEPFELNQIFTLRNANHFSEVEYCAQPKVRVWWN